MKPNFSPINIGKIHFDFSRPYVMGILNVTPDSFSDGGNFFPRDKAIEHAQRMREEGADIIDIGGESTRPGSDPVSAEEELERVIPVIEAIAPELKIPISIDTCKAEVAEKALDSGASMINDVTGLRGDDKMAALASSCKVPVVVMHMKGKPKTMQKNPKYDDMIGEIGEYFEGSIRIADDAGLPRDKLILDPGLGFGKTYEHNFALIRNLGQFQKFGLPLLVGASRKRFLSVDNKYPETERLEQSLAVACAAVENGANFVRVHDVLSTKKALWAFLNINI
ncbi:MAG: dihydropteroate synthase [candidate division Zixibacteria bacterium]|nr:dihydropteroate synthase [candidate division Zixibacteria bacterium]